MNSQEIKTNICRICLDKSVVLDWNTTLYGHCDITYKDCFYKYTQLDCPALDQFSPMLCQICLSGLHNVHTLVLKALESHEYFQETSSTNLNHSINLKDVKYTPTEFETILVETIEVEPIIQDHFVYEHSDEEFISIPEKTVTVKKCKRNLTATSITTEPGKCKNIDKFIKIEKKFNTESTIKVDHFCYNFPQSLNESSKKSKRKPREKKQVVDQVDDIEKLIPGNKITDDQKEGQVRVLEDDLLDSAQVESKVKKRYKEIKKPRMCSICSKILHNNYSVQMHEKTHIEHRERKETCKVCGLKFYDKRNLYSHKRIHKENREKTHKCEFCNKAFYDKSGLNIHLRLHLGQMIPCSLCTKQYYRQIDLDRHMSSHSATTINSETKKRSRYFVRCKYCDKSILSTSFKSHTAIHLNEPLMKCSICSKEFFHRGSCVLHVKKVHQKTNEEYNDFIIQYKKNRMSHLFLEQKAEIQYPDE